MRANIQKVESPSLFRCRFLAPCLEITLLGVVIAMAAAVRRGGLCPALRLVNRVVVINLLARCELKGEIVMALTGLSPYKPPIEQSLPCTCKTRYVIFTGGSDFDQAACEAARERASQMNAQFADARTIPFAQCRCGAILDFTTMDSCESVM